MNDPRDISRELKGILPFIPLMLIAGLVVALLSSGGAADAGKLVFNSEVEATSTPTATATNTATSTSTLTPTPTSTAVISGTVMGNVGETCVITAAVPISNAGILVSSSAYAQPYSTTASISGTFAITVPAPASVNISAWATGYLTRTTTNWNIVAGVNTFNPCITTASPPTPTSTATGTPTSTSTSTPTATPTGTATASPTQSATPTVTTTSTSTATRTPTALATVAGGQRGVVSASTGGTISTQDGRSTIVLPAGAVDGNTTIIINPKTLSNVPTTPSSFRLGSNLFSVEAQYNGSQLSSFRQSVTLRAKYNSTDLTSASNDPNRLSLAYYSPVSQMWLPIPSKVWPSDGIVEASSMQPAMFGVIIGQTPLAMATAVPPSPRTLPRTGDNVDWVMALLLAGLTSLTAGLIVRRLAKSQYP